MRIKELTQELNIKKAIGNLDLRVKQIVFDSRKVKPGDLFVAVRGTRVNGHKFIDKAIENGAIAIVAEDLPQALQQDIIYLQVEDSATSLGKMASLYFGHPSRQLKVVGVTGTNGKTTTVNLLFNLFTRLGYKCGLLSTIHNKIGQEILPATHTTPDAVVLNETLAAMVAAGCDYAFIEASSHAIHQKRIAGVVFAGGIFTNITHDHLDYHGTFKNYLLAKKAFFDELPKEAFALSNLDDKNGMVMVQNTKAGVYTYSLRTMADFKGKILSSDLTGLQLEFNNIPFFSPLLGKFNAYNLLATFGAAVLLDQHPNESIVQLSGVYNAEGRFDYVKIPGNKVTGIVDYAHTPDALLNILSTIKEVKPKASKLITLIGCGGDRDKEKRPVMASVAVEWSDKVILTSDNPRTEDPESIIEDMLEGINSTQSIKVLSIVNRREAIRTACTIAGAGDIVLVAGKGHEKYQEIMNKKHPFDDKEELKKALVDTQPT